MITHLYLHSPFCRAVCPYCDFHVVGWGPAVVEPYLARLAGEIASEAEFHGGAPPLTVYFGGGTPSLLPATALERVVAAITTGWGWPPEEATIEANPDDVTPAALASWRELGFNRVSLGVQSFDDSALSALGRRHTAAAAIAAVDVALDSGLEVSVDLITSIPLDGGRTHDSRGDLEVLGRAGVPHVSAYSLTVEPGSRFHRWGVIVDPDADADAFAAVPESLAVYGLERYEVSNYARPGHESRHNLAYWENRHYAGLGPSAGGHYPALRHPVGVLGERRTNPRLRQWLAGAAAEILPLSARDLAADCLLMGLRLRKGLDLRDVALRTGLDLENLLAAEIGELVKAGNLELDLSTLRATEKGLWHLDGVSAALLEALAEAVASGLRLDHRPADPGHRRL